MRRSARLCSLASLALVTVWAEPGSVSMPTLWRYSHPEAKALIGIEWQRVLQSRVGREVREKIREAGPAGFAGLDFLESVERIVISSAGHGKAGGPEHPPAVIAAQGKFDIEKLRALAATKLAAAGAYHSVEILEENPGGERPMALALVSPLTVLLGDSGSVRAALDNYFAEDPSQLQNPLFVRAAELAAASDLWIVAHASLADFSHNSQGRAQFLNDVESLEAGLSFRDGMELQVNLDAKSPESAQNLAGGLQFLLGMAMARRQQETGAPDLTRNLRVFTDGDLVRMTLRLNEAELEAGFREMAPSVMAALHADSAPPEGTTAPAAVRRPTQRRVIRIYGLAEGIREVPLGR